MIKNFLFLFVVSFSFILSAQMNLNDEMVFDCYDSLRGMPQNSAQSFIQNNDGFIYIATQGGIVKFDGILMEIFDKSNLEGLPSNLIRDIVIESSGNVFIATNRGLVLYDQSGNLLDNFEDIKEVYQEDITSLSVNLKTGELFGTIADKGVFSYGKDYGLKMFSPDNNLLETTNVNKVFITKGENVLLSSKEGLYILTKNRFEKINNCNDSLTSISETKEGILYVGGYKGIYKIKEGKLEKFFSKNEFLSNDDDILSLFVDSSDSLFIGTSNNGLIKYSQNNFYNIESSSGTTVSNIISFFEDRERNLWVGTSNNGFCILKKGKIAKTILKNHLVLGISEDSNNNLWVNCAGHGAAKVSKENGEIKIVSGDMGTNFTAVFADKSGNVWISTKNKGVFISSDGSYFKKINQLYKNSPTVLPENPYVFFEDGDGVVWTNDRKNKSKVFSFFKNKILTYDMPDKNIEVTDIIKNKRGELIIATNKHGIFKKDKITGNFNKLMLNRDSIYVKHIFIDSKERLWISTFSDGIYVFIEGDMIKLSMEKGLFYDSVHSILEDEKGNFWFSTNKGLFLVENNGMECFLSGYCNKFVSIVYDESEGMPSSECNGGIKPSMIKSSDGTIWIPTVKGAVNLDPLVKYETSQAPLINLTWISINNDLKNKIRIQNNSEIKFPSGIKDIEIFFSAPVFAKSGKVLFDYEFDNKFFVNMTKKRSAYFNNLNAGIHKFKVRAYYSGDEEKNFSEKEITIKIKPLFYEKENFNLVLFLSIVLIVSALFLMSRRAAHQREMEMTAVINEKTYELLMKNNELKDAVMKDPLTDLRNRRYLFEIEEENILNFVYSMERKTSLNEKRKNVALKGEIFAVMMIDIDHFKRINDIYGHGAGDMILVKFASILRETVRKNDVIIRWGGEEFLVILKNIERLKAVDVAEKIRKNVEKNAFTTEDGQNLWITASVGMSYIPFYDFAPNLISLENTISITDLALYHSKNKGRDMCTVVNSGIKMPVGNEEMQNMLSSYEYAELQGFYTFKKVIAENFEEFEIGEV